MSFFWFILLVCCLRVVTNAHRTHSHSLHYNNHYNKTFPHIQQCCAAPVLAFRFKAFFGPCACVTLGQKWSRYKDWVHKSGGYIHPLLQMQYHYQRDKGSDPNTHFAMHDHERSVFANGIIYPKEVLMQIPISISFSQLLVQKYIYHSDREVHGGRGDPFQQRLMHKLFPKPTSALELMPKEFPDLNLFLKQSNVNHTKVVMRRSNARAWQTLGFAWLKKYTNEILPWFELLPSPYYLPLLWNRTKRDDFILKDTRALEILQALEATELTIVYPYLDVLQLTEKEVKEAYAWLVSRGFGIGFEELGGSEHAATIPCGFDFFNHDVTKQSHIHYDAHFGRYVKHNTYDQTSMYTSQLLHKKIHDSNIRTRTRAHTRAHTRTHTRTGAGPGVYTATDFESAFLFVSHWTALNKEVVVSYGRHHSSAARLAMFGFIDDSKQYDFVTIEFNFDRIDAASDHNLELKRDYFERYWAIDKPNSYFPVCLEDGYTIGHDGTPVKRESKHERLQRQHVIVDWSSWTAIGRSHFDRINEQSSLNTKQKTDKYHGDSRFVALYPPMRFHYKGQKSIIVSYEFFNSLRLLHLPMQHFDSFTISSIINGFEDAYLRKFIDPLVTQHMRRLCADTLHKYPTTLQMDQRKLHSVEHRRRSIVEKLDNNEFVPLTRNDRQHYFKMLRELNRHSLVLQYRIREKTFFAQCLNVHLKHKPKPESARKQKRKKKTKRKLVEFMKQMFMVTDTDADADANTQADTLRLNSSGEHNDTHVNVNPVDANVDANVDADDCADADADDVGANAVRTVSVTTASELEENNSSGDVLSMPLIDSLELDIDNNAIVDINAKDTLLGLGDAINDAIAELLVEYSDTANIAISLELELTQEDINQLLLSTGDANGNNNAISIEIIETESQQSQCQQTQCPSSDCNELEQCMLAINPLAGALPQPQKEPHGSIAVAAADVGSIADAPDSDVDVGAVADADADDDDDIVSKHDILIGSVREGHGRILAQTLGWNSPNARATAAAGGVNQKGIRIANAQIAGVDRNQHIIVNGNADTVNDDNKFNSNNEKDTAIIPETVPFDQLVADSATVSVFAMDGSGNVINIAQALGGNNNANLQKLLQNLQRTATTTAQALAQP